MKIYGPTWADSLRDLQYPFAIPGPIRAEDGTVLDPDVITDIAVFVSATATKVLLYDVVVVQGAQATFRFADTTGTTVGSVVVTPGDTSGRVGVELSGVNTGFMTFDVTAMRGLLNWSSATYGFRAELVPHVLVFSDPAWRRGVVLPDGTVLTGEIWLIGAGGIQFEATATGFLVHAYGDPYAGRTGPRRTFTALSGVSPDQNGNINVIPSGLLSRYRINVVPLGGGKIRVEVVG
jgi:hypothetical protein